LGRRKLEELSDPDGPLPILVDALSEGKIQSQADLARYARALNVGQKWLSDQMKNAKTARAVGERVQLRAMYIAATALGPMGEKAKENVNAFRAVCQLATLIPVGGISFQQNLNIDARQGSGMEASNAFARNFWERVREAHGAKLSLVGPQNGAIDAESEPSS